MKKYNKKKIFAKPLVLASSRRTVDVCGGKKAVA
jgi:hypothetical protein